MKRQIISFAASVGAIFLTVGISIAFASFTFNGNSVVGSGSSTVDATGTVSIGTAQATGITIGRAGIATSLLGNLVLASTTISGNATTTGNLVVQGLLLDGSGNQYSTSTGGGSSQWTNTSTGIYYNGGDVSLGVIPASSSVLSFGNVAAYGDSLSTADGGTAWPTQLHSLSGANVAIEAFSGYTSSQVLTVFNATPQYRNWLNVIWVGRNNFASTTQVMADIASMVSALPAGSRYVVMTVITANGTPAEAFPGGSEYADFTTLENDIISTYPNNYIDIWSDLWNAAAPSGIDPDPTAFSQHTTPANWVSAGVHLNTAGYGFVAQMVYNWMQTHGGQYVPNYTSVNQALYDSGALGRTVTAGGTGQAQTVTVTPIGPVTIGADVPDDGTQVCWQPAAANTGAAPTLAYDGLIAYPIVKAPAGSALVANDIVTTSKACAIFNANSDQWELQDPQTSAGSSASTVAFVFQNATTTAPAFQAIQAPNQKTLASVSCSEYAAATTTIELYYNTTNASSGIQQVVLPSIACGISGASTASFTTSTIPANAYLFAAVTATAGTPSLTTVNVIGNP